MESPYRCDGYCCVARPCSVPDACGGVFRAVNPSWFQRTFCGSEVTIPVGSLVTIHSRSDGHRSGMGSVLVVKKVMPPYIFFASTDGDASIGIYTFQDDLRNIQILPITDSFARQTLGRGWKAIVAKARAKE